MDVDKLITGLMGGLSDLFSLPHCVILLLLAVVVLMAKDEFVISIRALMWFIGAYFVYSVFLRVGLLSDFLGKLPLLKLTGIFYTLIGLLCIFLGILFAAGWYKFYRSGYRGEIVGKVSSPGKILSFGIFITAIVSGVLFAVAGFSWPINPAVQGLLNDIVMPGLLWGTVGVLVLYEAVFVLLMTAFFCLIRFCIAEKQRVFFEQYRSLLLSVFSGVYTAIGVGLLVTFVKQMI